MHFASRKRLIGALTAAVALAVLHAAPAAAQTPSAPNPSTLRSTHGAWSVICDTPAGASEEQCAMMQNVVAEDRPEIELSVMVFKTADRKAKILRVITPLGVFLPKHLGLNIDGNFIGDANYIRCFSDGCYVEVGLTDDLLKQLRAGTTAAFILYETPEDSSGIGIPVELKGFAEGYDALP